VHSERYSPDLERRYEATISESRTTLPKKWPLACGGAANAFLVLLGPSMGAAARDEPVEVGGANRPQRYPMQIGQGVMDFEGLGRRRRRWQRLCARNPPAGTLRRFSGVARLAEIAADIGTALAPWENRQIASSKW
jgi:hypothetical protein